MKTNRAIALLIVAVIIATAFGSYSAIELRNTQATCDQLNLVIRHTNTQAKIMKRLLNNAADTREASALLASSTPVERRINQRAAYLYRLDADIISPTASLSC